jgi:nucleoid DNA-binding protein
VLYDTKPIFSATGKVTKATFASFISGKLLIPEPLAQGVWEQMCELIRKALMQGRPVCLTNIGTLESYKKKPTTYRHPVTGEVQKTKRCKHVRFHLAPKLKEALRT